MQSVFDEMIINEVGNSTNTDSGNPSSEAVETLANTNNNNTIDENEQLQKEIKHLNERICNLQESIQFSSSTSALFDIQTWEENCLNAVKNCVHEWRHIVSFHLHPLLTDPVQNMQNSISATGYQIEGGDIDQEQEAVSSQDNDDGTNADDGSISDDDNSQSKDGSDDSSEHIEDTNEETNTAIQNLNQFLNPNDVKIINSIALKIFGLIQTSMQVGPLKGSNPGYFKRCGVEVAIMAQIFLRDCVVIAIDDTCCDAEKDRSEEEENMIDGLRFTERQRDIVKKWMLNADKAVKANKAPSKSALKLQSSAISKKSLKKEKWKKKKKKRGM